jgi:hypothetical protein
MDHRRPRRRLAPPAQLRQRARARSRRCTGRAHLALLIWRRRRQSLQDQIPEEAHVRPGQLRLAEEDGTAELSPEITDRDCSPPSAPDPGKWPGIFGAIWRPLPRSRTRGSAHKGTATGDRELNPGALPPAVVPMWVCQSSHDLVTVWPLRVRTAWFAPMVRSMPVEFLTDDEVAAYATGRSVVAQARLPLPGLLLFP